MPSFYVGFDATSKSIEIVDDEYHHIVNVFRHKKGDIIRLVNGCGLRAEGVIEEITKKKVMVSIQNIERITKPPYKIACAFSLLKNKHDLLIVEKLTELGVSDLFPMQTVNSVKISKDTTPQKLIKTAIAAAKQCDNAWLPTLHDVSDLKKVIFMCREMGYLPVVASERIPENTLRRVYEDRVTARGTPTEWTDGVRPYDPETRNPKPAICIIIGPEGGFAPSEFQLFEKENITQVSLCGNVLRAETAAICAVSQMISL